MVQRTKEDDATMAEVLNIVRALRGSLAALAQQLDDESDQLVE
jgi:hypothetical protein